ncbi:MAG: hypothetical protein I8H77_14110 [Comamonadaceae bacterium]|nr:hypothetical protein [Comamonadaceae bacterium]
MANSTNGISFAYISETMGSTMGNIENALRAQISNMGENPTQTELFQMQVGVQKWTMTVQLMSTMNQTISEAFKGVIQKTS